MNENGDIDNFTYENTVDFEWAIHKKAQPTALRLPDYIQ